MCPSYHKHGSGNRSNQAGLGLPAAIFVITILSLIVLALANLEAGSGEALGQDVQSARALLAADSGAEIVLGMQFGPGVVPVDCDTCNDPEPHSVIRALNFDSLSGGAPPGLAECQFEVRCCQRTNTLAERFYKFTSTGSCGSGLDEARRIVEVAAKEVVP
ncbi:MAG: hypothetical protein MI864_08715 [Pseudomonadales bacterium]|uniref:Membrane protein n=1 Tax=Oleiphilus messinensis TaxID=141451 RepID=A0A1Y0I600_9GAMM|nr:hypothetical protein [Oleiphilus messinensis]ARU54823.1 membrane protein [Oleiphilus messinensis]MCG8610603.1 hypothetical protein [Pseudomonadales bacterium]